MASIFKKILSRKIPGHFVWEDNLCFSIMTIQPIREGHLMVIPKLEVDHWDDVPPETAAHLMLVAQKIAKAIKGVIPCKRIGLSVVGLEVAHTHIHLIPIDTTADLDFSLAQDTAPERLAATAGKIIKSLQDRGYSEADV
ncbi:MAG: HIT family protein [Pseudohongiellaceae bacterium]